MASDLISRDALCNVVRGWYWNGDIQKAKDDPAVIDAMTDLAIRTIKEAPAVDAVEVVRCKDCLHSEPLPTTNDALWCNEWATCTDCDGYCHNGRKKDAD